LAWEADIREEVSDLFEAAEEAVDYLVKGGIDPAELGHVRDPDDARSFEFIATGEAAQEIQRLEEAYGQLWAARNVVGRRVGEVLDSFARQHRDTASIERARQKRQIEDKSFNAKVEERQRRRSA
jgi:hypothetical protein